MRKSTANLDKAGVLLLCGWDTKDPSTAGRETLKCVAADHEQLRFCYHFLSNQNDRENYVC